MVQERPAHVMQKQHKERFGVCGLVVHHRQLAADHMCGSYAQPARCYRSSILVEKKALLCFVIVDAASVVCRLALV